MEHFKTPYLTVHWNEKVNCVHMQWIKFVKGKGFRNGMDTGLDLHIQKGSPPSWIADARNLQVLDTEDQNWTNTDWFPRALKSGIKNMALIIPKDIFAKLSVENIMNKVPDTDLTSKYFTSLEEAENWLIASR